MGKLESMGLSSSIAKDERMFKLKQLILQKKVFTVSACAKKMQLSRSTILKYLKEMNIAIYDDVKDDLTEHDDTTQIILPWGDDL